MRKSLTSKLNNGKILKVRFNDEYDHLPELVCKSDDYNIIISSNFQHFDVLIDNIKIYEDVHHYFTSCSDNDEIIITHYQWDSLFDYLNRAINTDVTDEIHNKVLSMGKRLCTLLINDN